MSVFDDEKLKALLQAGGYDSIDELPLIQSDTLGWELLKTSCKLSNGQWQRIRNERLVESMGAKSDQVNRRTKHGEFCCVLVHRVLSTYVCANKFCPISVDFYRGLLHDLAGICIFTGQQRATKPRSLRACDA